MGIRIDTVVSTASSLSLLAVAQNCTESDLSCRWSRTMKALVSFAASEVSNSTVTRLFGVVQTEARRGRPRFRRRGIRIWRRRIRYWRRRIRRRG